jgi:hypothetical protein
LETSLGGGKTHSLIALYHAAHSGVDPLLLGDFVDRKNILKAPVQRIATFIGDRVDGRTLPEVDGIKAKTLWGYLALQLGGPQAYDRIKADDEDRIAVGADTFAEIIGDEPTLIMIDEIPRYLEVVKGIVVGGNTLANQTVTFIVALIAAVKQKQKSVFVLTTTETTDVFGDEVSALNSAILDVFGRDEEAFRPTGSADLAAILRRRLFEATPPPSVAKAVAAEYVATAAAITSANGTLTNDASGPGWGQLVQNSYPFHPSVIEVLGNRLATIPRFQRTRGALRLVALALQHLWAKRPTNNPSLIHLHHLALDNPEIIEDVTSRIDRDEFEPVIKADIAAPSGSPRSHAEQIDATLGTTDGTHIATTIYYWSLTRDIPGVHENALLTSVLEPGLDLPRYQRALEKLSSDPQEAAWYLTLDPSAGYRFGTEPSPTKVLQDFENAISPHEVTTTATSILEDIFKRALGIRVQYLWQTNAIADNTVDCTLGIYHWDSFPGQKGGLNTEEPLPQAIVNAWTTAPAGGPRLAQNRLLFLAPDQASHADMLRTVRSHIARKQLVNSNDHMRRFNDAQAADLRSRAQTAALEAKVAVAAHMSILIVPDNNKLQVINLAPPSRDNFGANQTDRVIDQLKSDERVYVSGSKPPSVHMLKQKLGTFFDTPQTTADLLTKFATRTNLKIVLDPDPILQAIRNGIENGDWDYHDTVANTWATKQKPSGANIRIDAATYIEPAGSAPAPKPVACLFCGEVHVPGQIGCKSSGGGGTNGTGGSGGAGTPVKREFVGIGAPAETLVNLLAEAADASQEIREMRVYVEESDKAQVARQLNQLATLVPAGTKGLIARYDVSVEIALTGSNDSFVASFVGSDSEFGQWAKAALTTALNRPNNRDSVLKAALSVEFDTPQTSNSPEITAVIKRAGDTGPSQANITLSSESVRQPA